MLSYPAALRMLLFGRQYLASSPSSVSGVTSTIDRKRSRGRDAKAADQRSSASGTASTADRKRSRSREDKVADGKSRTKSSVGRGDLPKQKQQDGYLEAGSMLYTPSGVLEWLLIVRGDTWAVAFWLFVLVISGD